MNYLIIFYAYIFDDYKEYLVFKFGSWNSFLGEIIYVNQQKVYKYTGTKNSIAVLIIQNYEALFKITISYF